MFLAEYWGLRVMTIIGLEFSFTVGVKVKSFIGWGLQAITPYSLDKSGCHWLGPKENTVLANGVQLAKNCVASDKATTEEGKNEVAVGIETPAVSAEITRIRKERNRHQDVHNMNNYMRLVEINLYIGAISLRTIPQSWVIDSLFIENDSFSTSSERCRKCRADNVTFPVIVNTNYCILYCSRLRYNE